MDLALEEYRRLDILVNNAGIDAPAGNAWDLPDEEWQRTIDVNLSGVFYCSRAALTPMLEAWQKVRQLLPYVEQFYQSRRGADYPPRNALGHQPLRLPGGQHQRNRGNSRNNRRGQLQRSGGRKLDPGRLFLGTRREVVDRFIPGEAGGESCVGLLTEAELPLD